VTLALAAAAISAITIRTALTVADTAPVRRGKIEALASVIRRQTKDGDLVAFISTAVPPTYPALLYSGRKPGTRYLNAFAIAFFYEGVGSNGRPVYRSPAEQPPEERQFLRELGEDVTAKRPALIFIDQGKCQGCVEGFSIDEYLAQAGWKQNALRSYTKHGTWREYAIYRRR
jgi:hypothetical protein